MADQFETFIIFLNVIFRFNHEKQMYISANNNGYTDFFSGRWAYVSVCGIDP